VAVGVEHDTASVERRSIRGGQLGQPLDVMKERLAAPA
jgi:hypothetical protein